MEKRDKRKLKERYALRLSDRIDPQLITVCQGHAVCQGHRHGLASSYH